MSRIVRTAAVAVTAAAGIAVLAPVAHAEQMPVLVSQSPTGSHQIWVSPSEDYPDAGSQTYWGFVPLDGLCGFAGSGLTLSDIREVYSVAVKQNGAKAGSSNGVGKIEDEKFTLVEKDAAGTPLRTFTGTSTEYAQFRGTGVDGQMADQSVNLRVSFRGADASGIRIAFAIKLRVRADAVGKQQFSAELDGCHVGR